MCRIGTASDVSFSRDRQSDRKTRTLSRRAVDGDRSAMIGDDAPGLGETKAQPSSRFPAGKKWIEQMTPRCFCNSRPRVAHADDDEGVVGVGFSHERRHVD